MDKQRLKDLAGIKTLKEAVDVKAALEDIINAYADDTDENVKDIIDNLRDIVKDMN